MVSSYIIKILILILSIYFLALRLSVFFSKTKSVHFKRSIFCSQPESTVSLSAFFNNNHFLWSVFQTENFNLTIFFIQYFCLRKKTSDQFFFIHLSTNNHYVKWFEVCFSDFFLFARVDRKSIGICYKSHRK